MLISQCHRLPIRMSTNNWQTNPKRHDALKRNVCNDTIQVHIGDQLKDINIKPLPTRQETQLNLGSHSLPNKLLFYNDGRLSWQTGGAAWWRPIDDKGSIKANTEYGERSAECLKSCKRNWLEAIVPRAAVWSAKYIKTVNSVFFILFFFCFSFTVGLLLKKI